MTLIITVHNKNIADAFQSTFEFGLQSHEHLKGQTNKYCSDMDFLGPSKIMLFLQRVIRSTELLLFNLRRMVAFPENNLTKVHGN